MRHFFCSLALLVTPLCSFAEISVTRYFNADNLNNAVELISDEIYLQANYTGGSYPTASIRNLMHLDFTEECLGESEIGFMRHRITVEDCLYFFRASDVDANDPANGTYLGIETHPLVYWMAENKLVDGAQWGSDNFVMMRDMRRDGVVVAILQINFDEATGEASLIASAIDWEGLSYTDGVKAIEAASIPEPATFAFLAAAGALAFVAGRRRHRA